VVILDTFLDVSQQGATFVPFWTPWEDSGSILGGFGDPFGSFLVLWQALCRNLGRPTCRELLGRDRE
jgi:hypothetical protein